MLSRPVCVCVHTVGGDLFAGVKVEGLAPGTASSWQNGTSPLTGVVIQKTGEVAALSGEFMKVLFALSKKRVRMPSPKSPLYGLGMPVGAPDTSVVASSTAPYPQIAAAFLPEKSQSVKAREEAALEPPLVQPLTKWNRLVSKIFFCLLLPTMAAMIIVSSTTTAWVWSDIVAWMAPVKATMVAEELANLNVRCYERAQFVSAYIDTAAGSLDVLHDYSSQLVDGELPHGEPRKTHLSPGSSYCPTSDINNYGLTPNYYSCTSLSTQLGPRPATTQNRYSSSAVYRPSSPLPSVLKTIAGTTIANIEPDDSTTQLSISSMSGAGHEWLKEQLLASQMDTAFSAVFFASNITYAYAAFHDSEIYRQFPYQNFDSFVQGSRQCSAFPNQAISAYTPICRPWYQSAINDPSGDVVYNRVLSDAVNVGQMFLSLSKALKTASGSLVGVVAVDVGLLQLGYEIGMDQAEDGGTSTLYQRGYAMVWDENGYGVVHKNYIKPQFANIGPLSVAQLDAGADVEFQREFEANVVNRTGVTGNWSWPWFSPDKGDYEVWHYSFMPVPGTPYTIALTVVADEVTEVADNAQERMVSLVRGSMGGSITICVLILLLLFLFTWYLNHRFAKPLLKLLKLVRSWGDRDFAGKIDVDDSRQASSWELSVLMSNFKKLLIAMRFGNEEWAKGNQTKVMMNNFGALTLVESTGNTRGMGVVLNKCAPPPPSISGQSRCVRAHL